MGVEMSGVESTCEPLAFLQSRPRRFWIIDPAMLSTIGHHYDASIGLARAAASMGLTSAVFTHQTFSLAELKAPVNCIPYFRFNPYDPETYFRNPKIESSSEGVSAFVLEMLELFANYRASKDDIVFIHSTTTGILEGVLEILLQIGFHNTPRLHLLLRYDERYTPFPSRLHFVEVLQSFHRFGVLNREVFLYAETEALQQFYSDALGDPEAIDVLYHFSAVGSLNDEIAFMRDLSDQASITLAYFGDAREEKGFHHLPALVREFCNADQREKVVRFVIQVSHPLGTRGATVEDAIAVLRSLRGSRVYLAEGALTSDEYARLFHVADAILLPYDAEAYRMRGSGIAIDALCAGKPAVVPSSTWMAHHMMRGADVQFASPELIRQAINEMISTLSKRRQAAVVSASYYRALHSATETLSQLLRRTTIASIPAEPPPIVLHIAPMWAFRRGNKVLESQLRFLNSIGWRIFCIGLSTPEIGSAETGSTCDEVQHVPRTGAIYAWSLSRSIHAERFEKLLTERPRTFGESLEYDLRFAFDLEVPESLAKFVECHTVAAIVLNYVHTFPVALRLLGKGTPILLDVHELGSKNRGSMNEHLKNPAEALQELTICSQAHTVISGNEHDSLLLRRSLGSTYVETAFPFLGPIDDDLYLFPGCRHLLDVVSNCGPVQPGIAFRSLAASMVQSEHWVSWVLFVGGNHSTDAKSLRWFFEKVFEPFLFAESVRVLVVGDLNSKVSELSNEQFVFIGEVLDRAAMIAAAPVVVLPFISRTEIPTQTVEVTGLRTAFSATSGAFYGVDLRIHNIPTFDDPADMAADILELLRNEEARETRRETAERLAHEVFSWRRYSEVWAGALARATGLPVRPNDKDENVSPRAKAKLAWCSPLRLAINRVRQIDGQESHWSPYDTERIRAEMASDHDAAVQIKEEGIFSDYLVAQGPLDLRIDTIPKMNPGDAYTFGFGAPAMALCRGGVFASRAESSWCWTYQHIATLLFRIAETEFAVRLRADPFLVRDQVVSQRVRIFVNETALCTVIFREEQQEKVILVPRENQRPDGVVVMRLILPDACSPAELGLSPDPRFLGLALKAISIERPDIEGSSMTNYSDQVIVQTSRRRPKRPSPSGQ
jgi:glycosyltransferase involved in cell wall biosynthesis